MNTDSNFKKHLYNVYKNGDEAHFVVAYFTDTEFEEYNNKYFVLCIPNFFTPKPPDYDPFTNINIWSYADTVKEFDKKNFDLINEYDSPVFQEPKLVKHCDKCNAVILYNLTKGQGSCPIREKHCFINKNNLETHNKKSSDLDILDYQKDEFVKENKTKNKNKETLEEEILEYKEEVIKNKKEKIVKEKKVKNTGEKTSYQKSLEEINKNKVITRLLTGAKKRAKDKNMDFNIDKEDINIPDRCPILDLPFEYNTGTVGPMSPSLDRIDSTLGYIKGNVKVISHRANTIKNNLALEDLVALGKYAEKGLESL